MNRHQVILFPCATSSLKSPNDIEFPDAALRGIDAP